ncbi:MAG: fatty acid desaturase [Pirellulaceae bacterium]
METTGTILDPPSGDANELPRVPSAAEVKSTIPRSCFQSNLPTSLKYAGFSLGLTFICAVVGATCIPIHHYAIPLWIGYALITGTVATGCWVIAHECGHGAFCRRKWLENAIGYIIHSLMLVPYFSWQRSHSIHHARTNHLELGETHVPVKGTETANSNSKTTRSTWQQRRRGAWEIFTHLAIGWPLYLMFGLTGGPIRGMTNHFWPYWPFSSALFPGKWKAKVLASTVGVLTTLIALIAWAWYAGSIIPVLLLYGGPYLVVNAWLVLYTWLHHTDVDVPHLDATQWTWIRGAFLTVDRPYGRLLNTLHHGIGSTHVVHHLCPAIPHYHAQEATDAIKNAFPDLYRFDATPIHRALWRIAIHCDFVWPHYDDWRFKHHADEQSI